MVALFVITAGVFYHQSAKFLDIRYAKHPLAEAHPYGFALDYGVLILTVAPFFLMAHALAPSVTHKVGYTWFFVSYVGLIGGGLILLIIQELRHSVLAGLLGESIPAAEVLRERTIRSYWLIMNSLVLLIIMGLFAYFRREMPCPTSPRPGEVPLFLYAFGGMALARDFLDYRYAWRFTYPVRADTASKMDLWPLTALAKSTRPVLWSAVSYLLVVGTIGAIIYLGFWNINYWRSVCAVSG
jgi:heme/copper-type cytochrome/quinol oxidase subunit 2